MALDRQKTKVRGRNQKRTNTGSSVPLKEGLNSERRQKNLSVGRLAEPRGKRRERVKEATSVFSSEWAISKQHKSRGKGGKRNRF